MVENSVTTQNKESLTLTEILEIKRSGKLNEVLKLLEKYTAQNPSDPEGFNLLGVTLADLGMHEQAVEAYQKALEIKPDFAICLNNLSVSYKKLNMFDIAKNVLQRAVEIDENLPEALNNLANSLRDEGYLNDARKLYEKALSLVPNSVEIKINLAIVLTDLGEFKSAERLLREVLTENPNFLVARRTLGHTLSKMGKFEEAENELRLCLLLNQRDPKTLCELGTVLITCEPGYPKEAEELLKMALALDPNDFAVYHNLGVVYNTIGRYKEAEKCFEKAYQLKPNNSAILRLLLSVRKNITEDDPYFKKLKELENKDLPIPQKTEVLYALVEAYEKMGNDEMFFKYLLKANALKRKQLVYEHSSIKDSVDSRIKVFSEEAVKKNSGYAYPSATPIFIVGMPRSGTTLMESILAAHPDVYGAGELKLMRHVLKDGIVIENILFTGRDDDRMPEMVLQAPMGFFELGRRYVTQLREMAPEAKRITDKMPSNYLNIGLICLGIGWARIIHMRRHPMDTILSCFRQPFSEGHEFTYDLTELAMFYNEYFRMMKHWREVFPNRILDVDYESLVLQPEVEIRRVLQYCGLDWNDSCLKFYELKRAVKTASQDQVRKPLYTSSIGKWRKFAVYMKPAWDALSAEVKAECARIEALVERLKFQ